MHFQPEHGAAARRPNIDPGQDVLGHHDLFPRVRHLGADIVQGVRDFVVEFEAGLLDLKFRFFDRFAEAQDIAFGKTKFALDAVCVAFKREIFVAGVVALCDQREHRRHLGLVARHLGCKRIPLARAAGDVLLLLLDLGGENADLAIQRLPALAKLPFLVPDRHIGLADVAACQQVGRKLDLIGLRLLGNETGFHGQTGVDLLAQQVEIGLGVGRLQAEKHVAFLHLLRVADQDFPDDAAFEMLDRLVVALNGDLALRNRGSIERGQCRPDAEAAEYQRDGGKAEAAVAAVVIYRSYWREIGLKCPVQARSWFCPP